MSTYLYPARTDGLLATYSLRSQVFLVLHSPIHHMLHHITIALAVYDIVLCLPQEVRGIWRRKWGTVTILYPIIRYGVTFVTCMQLVDGKSLNVSIPYFLVVRVEAKVLFSQRCAMTPTFI